MVGKLPFLEKITKEEKIHLMKYENLVENPKKAFTNMLEYMKSIFPVNIDSDRVEKAVEETSFNKLQAWKIRMDLLRSVWVSFLEKERSVSGRRNLTLN